MTRRRGKPFAEHLRDVRRGNDQCWLWPVLQGSGYGFTIYESHQMVAHRAVYLHLVGPIADGLTLDHLCRVRACVNPSHMEAVTIRENILRGTGRGAANAKKNACQCGAPFDAIRQKGGRSERHCRACGNRHSKASYRRNLERVKRVIADASARRARECARGHVRTPENTLVTYRGQTMYRYCLVCRAETPPARDARGRLMRRAS